MRLFIVMAAATLGVGCGRVGYSLQSADASAERAPTIDGSAGRDGTLSDDVGIEAGDGGTFPDAQSEDGTLDGTLPDGSVGGGVVVHVSTGHRHTCTVTGDGPLYCWGSNAQGELGLGDAGAGTDRIAVAAAGDRFGHTCGRRADGSVWC